MEQPAEFDIPVGAPHKASKPVNPLMIAGLGIVAAVVLGILFYSLSPFVSSDAVDHEVIPGVSEPK